MREEREVLEYHRDLGTPNVPQFGAGARGDIVAIDQYFAAGWPEQPVQHAHHGRFSGPGKSHDHKYLPLIDIKIGVLNTDSLAGGLED